MKDINILINYSARIDGAIQMLNTCQKVDTLIESCKHYPDVNLGYIQILEAQNEADRESAIKIIKSTAQQLIDIE